jgi:sigma-B regulation protein RsbU (phosphoserine phosphatase)
MNLKTPQISFYQVSQILLLRRYMNPNTLCGFGLTLAFLLCSFCLGAIGQDQVSPEAKAKVENATNLLAERLESNGTVNPAEIFSILWNQIEENPEIYGAAFAFAPAYENGTLILSAPYVYRDGDTIKEKYLPDNYNYPASQWYAKPVELQQPAWSDPYYDNGGAGADVLMTTYSVPIFTADKVPRLIGVLTGDLLIEKKP